MARSVKDANLGSRAARQRLKRQRAPHWRTIERGMHLGYRGGKRSGTWVARFHRGDGRYCETSLGLADDALDANGVSVFSFDQAQALARDWFTEQARLAAGLPSTTAGPYTISDAVSDYVAHFVARGGKGLREMRQAIAAHIEPTLGDLKLAKLTAKKLRDWQHALAAAPARIRTGMGDKQRYRKIDSDADPADVVRRRRVTANRIWATLRAALNHAFREGKVASDLAWRLVKPFRDVDAAVIKYLSEDECVRLINATDPAFRPLVRAALFTGCRLGELLRLRAGDYNATAGTLAVRSSKSGKPRHVVLTDEGGAFFEAVTAGMPASTTIFLRPDGSSWPRNSQQQPMAEACRRAKISPPVSFHVLRHTHASLLAMKNVPMPVIGQQLGHSPGSPMTAKHYAHLGSSYVSDTIRRAFPKLGIGNESNVTPLKPKRA